MFPSKNSVLVLLRRFSISFSNGVIVEGKSNDFTVSIKLKVFLSSATEYSSDLRPIVKFLIKTIPSLFFIFNNYKTEEW
jgi:hypothetical protein